MNDLPPHVAFFSKRSERFFQVGSQWRRATPEDDAHFRTGRDQEGERHLGVYMVPRRNGMVRVGFDLWRLDLNLRPEIIERLVGSLARGRRLSVQIPPQIRRATQSFFQILCRVRGLHPSPRTMEE